MIFEQVEFQHDVLHMKEQQITKSDFKTLLQKHVRLKLSHSKMHALSFLKLQLYIHRLRF